MRASCGWELGVDAERLDHAHDQAVVSPDDEEVRGMAQSDAPAQFATPAGRSAANPHTIRVGITYLSKPPRHMEELVAFPTKVASRAGYMTPAERYARIADSYKEASKPGEGSDPVNEARTLFAGLRRVIARGRTSNVTPPVTAG